MLQRIGIGKMVASTDCTVTYDVANGILHLSFKKLARATRRNSGAGQEVRIDVKLSQDSLIMFKYFKPSKTNDGDLAFVALQIDPKKSTGLGRYSSSYRPDGPDKCKYIVLNFFGEDQLDIFLQAVAPKVQEILAEAGEIQSNEIQIYAEAVLEAVEKEKALMRSSAKRSSFIAGRPEQTILLVYPFAGDPIKMEAAAEGLNEASGRPLDVDQMAVLEEESSRLTLQSNSGSSDSDDAEAKKKDTKAKARQHYVTIRVEDYERLEPQEWLNDSLVDFWMQWYVILDS